MKNLSIWMTSIFFSQLTTALDLGNEIDFITQYFFLEKKHVCFSWKINDVRVWNIWTGFRIWNAKPESSSLKNSGSYWKITRYQNIFSLEFAPLKFEEDSKPFWPLCLWFTWVGWTKLSSWGFSMLIFLWVPNGFQSPGFQEISSCSSPIGRWCQA